MLQQATPHALETLIRLAPSPPLLIYELRLMTRHIASSRSCDALLSVVQDFLEAAGSGSQGSTAAAGHLQFAALSSGTFGTLANIFCGRNSSIADEVW